MYPWWKESYKRRQSRRTTRSVAAARILGVRLPWAGAGGRPRLNSTVPLGLGECNALASPLDSCKTNEVTPLESGPCPLFATQRGETSITGHR